MLVCCSFATHHQAEKVQFRKRDEHEKDASPVVQVFGVIGGVIPCGILRLGAEPIEAVVVKAAKHAFAPPLSQIVPIPPHPARRVHFRRRRTDGGADGPRPATDQCTDSVLQESTDASQPRSPPVSLALSTNSGLEHSRPRHWFSWLQRLRPTSPTPTGPWDQRSLCSL